MSKGGSKMRTHGRVLDYLAGSGYDYKTAIQKAASVGINVSEDIAKKTSKDFAVESIAEIAWTKKEFPVVEDIRYEAGTYYRPSKAFAYSYLDDNLIAITARGKATYNKQKANYEFHTGPLSSDTFHPKNTTYRHVITHEMGHQVLSQISHRLIATVTSGAQKKAGVELQYKVADYVIQNAYNRLPKKYRTGGVEKAVASISGYAKTNGHETIAEAMADYRANGKKANPLSRAIYKELKKYGTASGVKKLAAEIDAL